MANELSNGNILASEEQTISSLNHACSKKYAPMSSDLGYTHLKLGFTKLCWCHLQETTPSSILESMSTQRLNLEMVGSARPCTSAAVGMVKIFHVVGIFGSA